MACCLQKKTAEEKENEALSNHNPLLVWFLSVTSYESMEIQDNLHRNVTCNFACFPLQFNM